MDVVELWVGDLRRMLRVLTAQFGLELETAVPAGRPDRRDDDEVAKVGSGDVRFVIRQGRSATSAIARHVARHGDGIADVALVTDEVDRIAARADALGLIVTRHDDGVRVDLLGDGMMMHTVRSRRAIAPVPRRAAPIHAIDHVTYCLPWGALDAVARVYRAAFAMEVVPNGDCAEVGDLARGMRSAVLRADGGFTIVLTEPRSADGDGQTERFVHARGGPGVQHIAIACDDLIAAAAALRARGVAFLPVPAEILDRSHVRLRDRPLRWDALRRHGILVDADAHGLLFQLFTRPIVESTGFFLELVERAGATGFGATNVSALFAAIDATLRTEVS